MRKSILKSLDAAHLFERIASAESRRLISSMAEGIVMPLLPSQDPSERLLLSNARNWITDELTPIMTEAAKASAEILSTNIPIDEPANIHERTRRNLELRFDQHKREAEERRQAISRIAVALRALRYTSGGNLGPHTRFRRQVLSKLAAFGTFEATYNGVNLFIVGYAGGLVRTVGIAAIVTVVNLLIGFLVGDVVTRRIKRRQASRLRRVLSWLPGLGLSIVALVNNLAMASLQAFAKEGVAGLWVALINWQFLHVLDRLDPTAGLIGVASAILGLFIVFMVARMWSRAETPEIDALETALAKQQQGAAEDQFAFSTEAIDIAEDDKEMLDELRDEAAALVSGTTQALTNIERDLAKCETEQHQIRLAHEGAGEMHRGAVRGSLPGMQLPGYFSQRVDYSEVVVTVTNASAVRDHVENLRKSLQVLEERVTQAKSDIERDLQQILGLIGPAASRPPSNSESLRGPMIEPAQ